MELVNKWNFSVPTWAGKYYLTGQDRIIFGNVQIMGRLYGKVVILYKFYNEKSEKIEENPFGIFFFNELMDDIPAEYAYFKNEEKLWDIFGKFKLVFYNDFKAN